MEGVKTHLIRELIVCDGGSTDNIAEIVDELGGKIVYTEIGRGKQLGAGANFVVSNWMLFLHADTRLQRDWSETVRKHITNYDDKAAYFCLKYRARGLFALWFAGWANLRSKLFGLPFGDQGLLISRSLYHQIGGYPDIPLMEDVAIAKKLRGKLMMLNCVVETSAQRYLKHGWLRCGAGNLYLFLMYLVGIAPERLWERYYSESHNLGQPKQKT